MVAQTSFILRANEASGRTQTNYGTVTGNYTMGQSGGVDPTDYTWIPGGGPLLGRFHGKTNDSATLKPWFSTSATTPGTTLQTINVMAAFNVAGIPSSGGLNTTRLWSPNGSNTDGDVQVVLESPSGSNFSCRVTFRDSIGNQLQYIFTSLTTNTDYIVAAGINVSNTAAVVAYASLNGAAAQTLTGTTNWGGGTNFNNTWPYKFRSQDWAQYEGINGYDQGSAYQRGGTAWGSSDVVAVSSDPSNIVGWSAAAAGQPSGKRMSGIPYAAGRQRNVW